MNEIMASYCLIEIQVSYCLIEIQASYCLIEIQASYCLIEIQASYCLIEIQASYAIEANMPKFRIAIEDRKYNSIPFHWPLNTAYIEVLDSKYCQHRGT